MIAKNLVPREGRTPHSEVPTTEHFKDIHKSDADSETNILSVEKVVIAAQYQKSGLFYASHKLLESFADFTSRSKQHFVEIGVKSVKDIRVEIACTMYPAAAVVKYSSCTTDEFGYDHYHWFEGYWLMEDLNDISVDWFTNEFTKSWCRQLLSSRREFGN